MAKWGIVRWWAGCREASGCSNVYQCSDRLWGSVLHLQAHRRPTSAAAGEKCHCAHTGKCAHECVIKFKTAQSVLTVLISLIRCSPYIQPARWAPGRGWFGDSEIAPLCEPERATYVYLADEHIGTLQSGLNTYVHSPLPIYSHLWHDSCFAHRTEHDSERMGLGRRHQTCKAR